MCQKQFFLRKIFFVATFWHIYQKFFLNLQQNYDISDIKQIA